MSTIYRNFGAPILLLLAVGALLTATILLASDRTERTSRAPATLPYYADPELTPRWITDASEVPAIPGIAPFSLVDQHGAPFTEKKMDGKITVVDFFFARCSSLCPRLARSMARIQDSVAAARDVMLLSYSVTPEIDSTPVLSRYARMVGAVDGKWYFLTGDRKSIYDAARRSYFAKLDTGEDAFLHTETFYLLDRSRRIRGIYNGTLQPDISRLIQDLRELQREE